jgi:outer membrane lipoprotein-sorting protein
MFGRLSRAAACALLVLAAASAPIAGDSSTSLSTVALSAKEDLFDEIYERGRGVDQSLKTLTARFVETSTSPLLERPLVSRGTLAVVRPSRIILRYQDPDVRAVLIDGDRLTLDWPARQLRQESNIATAMRRVQSYFVGKSPDELRKHFKIAAERAKDRPAYLVTLDPTRKQIRENLTKLELWIDRESLLLDAMRMHFVGGETKQMEFSEVVVNPPLDATTFVIRER